MEDLRPIEVLDLMMNEFPEVKRHVERLDEKYSGMSTQELYNSLIIRKALADAINEIVLSNPNAEEEMQSMMAQGILAMAEETYIMALLEENESMGIE